MTVATQARRSGFIRHYIFSTDHRIVGMQYMFTAIAMGLVGAALSILMRLQLAWPTAVWPLLGRILPAGFPSGIMSPEFYLSVQTMHGTIMAIFVLTAIFTGGFGNFLIPLQIGARDMAFPFLNMLSYWVYLLSCIVVVLAFFVEGGAPISGWTAYPPLSVIADAGPGQGLGQTVWVVAVALFIVSTMMGVLNYLTTILQMRTRGLSMMRLPLVLWSMLSSSVISLLVFPVLLAAGVLLLADRLVGTGFFIPAGLVFYEELIEQGGGSPLLWQHLFWFFGHPEVYIVILPAMGIAAEILATFTRKPVFGYRIIVACWIMIVVLSMGVWGHHMYTTGMNPWLGSFFALGTLLITVPSATLILCLIASLWGARIQFSTPMLFALGFLSVFTTGGLGGFFLGSSWTDVQLHDTYFVVGHFHLTMAMSPAFAVFAGLYYWFPRMFGRLMNETLGKIHFWLTISCSYLIFLTMHLLGVGGVLRHSFDHTQYVLTAPFAGLNVLVSVAAFVMLGAQVVFFANLGWSLFRGPKAGANPWNANTLEWQHGGPTTVYRWPYEYGDVTQGRDYLPQYEAGSLGT